MCAHAYPRLLVQGNRTDSNTYVTTYNRKIGCHKLFVCFRADTPPPALGHDLLIHEVSRSHTTTHHGR